MLENEPFIKLPVPYRPLPKVNHYPPILSFGFAIPNHAAEFHRVALKHNLASPEKLSINSPLLRTLVTSHLNERCGLPPGENILYGHIDSKESNLVLEIATNYATRVPGDKLDHVLRSIREVFSLPDDAQPKWYLDSGIREKDPDEYHLPRESSIQAVNDVVNDITYLAQCRFLNGERVIRTWNSCSNLLNLASFAMIDEYRIESTFFASEKFKFSSHICFRYSDGPQVDPQEQVQLSLEGALPGSCQEQGL